MRPQRGISRPREGFAIVESGSENVEHRTSNIEFLILLSFDVERSTFDVRRLAGSMGWQGQTVRSSRTALRVPRAGWNPLEPGWRACALWQSGIFGMTVSRERRVAAQAPILRIATGARHDS